MEKKRGLAATVVPVAPNLVSSWRNIATLKGQRKLVEALDDMNSTLGTRYTHDRITAWEQGLGGRKPNQKAINYMLAIVLPSILQDLGVSASNAKKITQQVQIVDID